jgi:deoxyribonuclease-4
MRSNEKLVTCYNPHEERLMRFGIHVPRQRSLEATLGYASNIGCEAIQIFSGNPMSWDTGSLDRSDRDRFVLAMVRTGIEPILLHTPYLINLASPHRRLQVRSRAALVAALTRAHKLGAGPVVVHAGNHMGAGATAGIERAVRMIAHALRATPAAARVAIENGVGKGTEIGATISELARIVEDFPPDRVGLVLDTAHLWGVGYDLKKESAVARLVDEVDAGPGLNRLWAIHGNDSIAELGSRRDRHALWTEGRMGRTGLRRLVGCKALSHLPFIFEVPGETPEFDRRRLASMRRLYRRLHEN